MAENGKQDILVMAIFMVTRDDVLACAGDLGMPEEQVTDDLIEMVRERVSQGLGNWRQAAEGMVKEAILLREAMKQGAIECPLGMVCSPSCAWWEVGQCLSPRGVE